MTDQIHITGRRAVTIVDALEHQREIVQPLDETESVGGPDDHGADSNMVVEGD